MNRATSWSNLDDCNMSSRAEISNLGPNVAKAHFNKTTLSLSYGLSIICCLASKIVTSLIYAIMKSQDYFTALMNLYSVILLFFIA